MPSFSQELVGSVLLCVGLGIIVGKATDHVLAGALLGGVLGVILGIGFRDDDQNGELE
ncbi:MAG: hypothetical protein MI755_23235 [Sphingomonadales bacterium]|nr:hypothetical protein [Sphingomonadales bacterium]